MKPKINRSEGTTIGGPYDRCNTPAYALTPLLPYLPDSATYWEPAVGTGNIAQALLPKRVIISDIQDGHNYFDWQPDTWDIQITNPPYSLKYKWLEHAYDLGKPFALLLPVETIGAKGAQVLMQRHGCELLLLNRRIDFDMPNKGYSGGGAQFPVLWFCWQLLPSTLVYGEINKHGLNTT